MHLCWVVWIRRCVHTLYVWPVGTPQLILQKPCGFEKSLPDGGLGASRPALLTHFEPGPRRRQGLCPLWLWSDWAPPVSTPLWHRSRPNLNPRKRSNVLIDRPGPAYSVVILGSGALGCTTSAVASLFKPIWGTSNANPNPGAGVPGISLKAIVVRPGPNPRYDSNPNDKYLGLTPPAAM